MRIQGLALLTAGWKVERVIEFIGISRSWLYDIKKRT